MHAVRVLCPKDNCPQQSESLCTKHIVRIDSGNINKLSHDVVLLLSLTAMILKYLGICDCVYKGRLHGTSLYEGIRRRLGAIRTIETMTLATDCSPTIAEEQSLVP